MKDLLTRLALAATVFLSFFTANAQQTDVLLTTMDEELQREMAALKKAEFPPYFMAYRVNDLQVGLIVSSFGSLVQSYQDRGRVLTTSIKVGDYMIDDSHELEDSDGYGGGYGDNEGNNSVLPLDDEPMAIRQALWHASESHYKQAMEAFKEVKKDLENNPPKAKKAVVADFSKETPAVYFEPPLQDIHALLPMKEWEEKIRSFSKPFLAQQDIISGDAILQFTLERKYFVSSEGTRVVQNMTYANLNISASIRADDEDIVPLYISYFAYTPAQLPSTEVILKDVAAMIDRLNQLKKAPLAEPYSGPAILHARSAGVFFHEIFGHRVEGHRLRSEDDGQTFKAKVHELVLPKTMNVIFDPTVFRYRDTDLVGAYKFDDEGIAARRVSVVKNGVLENFLMSRAPLENFEHSNGHGRAAAGSAPVSRQSNLMVETTRPQSMEDLRKMLLKECQRQNKRYGYLFKEVTGGFTNTDRYSANVFNIMPTEVYRVYTDGRPDELVRGVDLIGTPLAMFAEIGAAGNDNEIFTGVCGAESGGVPVSAISPSLFVRRIETQKKPKYTEKPPLLSRPTANP